MMTKEETMKVIAEEVRPEEYCPIVDEVARQTSYAFELAAESSFENDEDEIIFDLVMRLLGGGQYMEAVDVLAITFSLIGSERMDAMMALIGGSGRDEIYEMFMKRFVEHSPRCIVRKIDIEIEAPLS